MLTTQSSPKSKHRTSPIRSAARRPSLVSPLTSYSPRPPLVLREILIFHSYPAHRHTTTRIDSVASPLASRISIKDEMDTIDELRRSENMRRIRSKNTSPELLVRRLIHKMGFRFRLHRKDLPGRPDIVFPTRRKVIFVHGCFWHQHKSCRAGRPPRSREGYWLPKLQRNQDRDEGAVQALKAMAWKSLIVWECEVDDQIRLSKKLRRFIATS